MAVGQHGISGDLAKSFNGRIDELPDREELLMRLHDKLLVEAGTHWMVQPGASTAVSLHVSDISLAQMDWDQVKVVAYGRLDASFGDVEREIGIRYASQPQFVRQLAEEPALLGDLVERALDTIVVDSLATLRRPRTVQRDLLGEEPELLRLGTAH